MQRSPSGETGTRRGGPRWTSSGGSHPGARGPQRAARQHRVGRERRRVQQDSGLHMAESPRSDSWGPQGYCPGDRRDTDETASPWPVLGSLTGALGSWGPAVGGPWPRQTGLAQSLCRQRAGLDRPEHVAPCALPAGDEPGMPGSGTWVSLASAPGLPFSAPGPQWRVQSWRPWGPSVSLRGARSGPGPDRLPLGAMMGTWGAGTPGGRSPPGRPPPGHPAPAHLPA